MIEPYNVITKVTEVEFLTVPLWVRIYDLPEFMMNEECARTLGEKLGKVVKYGGAISNFLRVRVNYLLEKPLKTCCKIRIEGKVSTILPKYKNVPFFCFVCATIGHDWDNCPEHHLLAKGTRYGKDLRASPLKRQYHSRLSVPVAQVPAARALNFSGTQKEKVLSAASSNKSNQQLGRGGKRKRHWVAITDLGKMSRWMAMMVRKERGKESLILILNWNEV